MTRLIAIVALTLVPFAAAAQGVLATQRPITWGMIFALLFLMLGPIKLLGPFAAATKDCNRIFRLRLATRAIIFAAAAVTIAAAKRRHNDPPRASWMAYIYADIKQADETAANPIARSILLSC